MKMGIPKGHLHLGWSTGVLPQGEYKTRRYKFPQDWGEFFTPIYMGTTKHENGDSTRGETPLAGDWWCPHAGRVPLAPTISARNGSHFDPPEADSGRT